MWIPFNESFWCRRVGLNHRDLDFQSSALPSELQRHLCGFSHFRRFPCLVINPSPLAIRRSGPLTLLLYVGCVLIPKNILGALFYFVAPVLKVTSEYSVLFGCSRGIRTPSLGYEPSELPLLHHCDIYGQFTRTMPRSLRKETMSLYVTWYLRLDSNQRSSGYEPDVLVN